MSKAQQAQAESSQRPYNDGEGSEDVPPSYSEPATTLIDLSSSNTLPEQNTSTPGILPINFKQYLIPGATLSKDQTTITISNNAALLSDPVALTKFITDQAALPPKPLVRIMGMHMESGQRKIDFDIRLNMQRFILRPQSSAPWNYIKLAADGSKAREAVGGDINASIAAWATRFSRDPAMSKSFTLHRDVIHWDTHLLDGRLRSLLASLRYQGRISITFPNTHSKVVVQTTNTLYTRLVSLVKGGSNFEPVQSIWPYADVAVGADGAAGRAQQRVCAVQSENAWWRDWSETIALAVLDKRQGWITLDDLMEVRMSPKRDVIGKKEWGMDT